jgi:branched-chain amino acid transport system permease protein
MEEFAQQVVSGLASGGIYASLALALVLIYRTTRAINFAQGEMAMFTTFIAWSLTNHGLSKWLAFPLTLGIAFVLGVALERTLIRPFEGRGTLTLAIVIVTLGLLVAFNGLALWIWSGEPRQLPSLFSQGSFELLGVTLSYQDVGIIGVTLGAALVLWLFFTYTKVGLGLRAAALNPDASRLVGVRVGWMLALGWGLAAALGALSGILVAPIVFLDPNMMQGILLFAFAAAVLGGIDSLFGAVVGGLAFGVILNLLDTYLDKVGLDVGAQLRLPLGLGVILIVLLIRPSGLFGKAQVRRV